MTYDDIEESHAGYPYRISMTSESHSVQPKWTVSVSGLPQEIPAIRELEIMPRDGNTALMAIPRRRWFVTDAGDPKAKGHEDQTRRPDTADGSLTYAVEYLRRKARQAIDQMVTSQQDSDEMATAWLNIGHR